MRGYVSTVITCPYEGAIEPRKVRDVSKELVDLGCYEISLGDTVGTGTPKTMGDMLNSVIRTISVDKLAVSALHCGVVRVLMSSLGACKP